MLSRNAFLSELALTGELRPVNGVLPAALAAARLGRPLIVPPENAAEAGWVSARCPRPCLPTSPACPCPNCATYAANRRHDGRWKWPLPAVTNLLLIGTPGCGKTLLASRLPGVLPDATDLRALETATVASCSGGGIDTARLR